MEGFLGTIAKPPALFQANWPEVWKPTPYSEAAKVVWNIFSIIIFPIGLLRLIDNGVFSLGGRIIHPASGYGLVDHAARARLQRLGGKIERFNTPDGQTLEAMHFKGSSSSKRGIVYALGNGEFLDYSSEGFLQFVRKNVGNVDVLVLNNRGVGKSTGSSSPTGLALDTYSAGEYLRKQRGINPSHVLFDGHSLGGYSALKGAWLFQKQHDQAKVSILSDRSFSTLSDAAAKIANFIIGLIVTLLHWELDARDTLEDLKGQKIVTYDKRDQVIPYNASFHNAIKDLPSAKSITPIEMVSKGPAAWDPHNRGYTPEEARRIGREMRRALSL